MTKHYILTPDDVVNDLTSDYEDVPLSAKQGKVLNDKKATVYYGDTEPTTAVEGDYWANGEISSVGDVYASDIKMSSANPKKVDVAINECEVTANKTTTISAASTDIQYPTAKAVATMMQTFYDALYPVGSKQICFNEPVVPSGVTATWTVDTTYDGKALWIDSTKTFGTSLNGSLPKITGDYNPVVYGFNAECVYAVSCNWASGAFYLSPNQFPTNNVCASQTGTRVNPQYNTAFDAARCNSVYGASAGANVVRPTSVTVKVYVRAT